MCKRILWICLVLFLSAAVVVLASGKKETPADQQLVVGFSLMNVTNPQFYDQIEEVTRIVEKENGGKLIIHDAQFDAAKQVSGLEDFISQKVDGILVISVDSEALGGVVKKAKEAGIPVVAIDADCNAPDKVAFVTSDNFTSGQLIGDYMAKRLNGMGNVALIDYPVLQVCRDRIDGIMDAFKGYPDIKVIANQKGGSMTDALKIAETWLQKYPDIDAIYGINDQNALGALTALENAGREKETFVVGNDGTPEAYEAMKKGRNFGATIKQQSALLGKNSIETLLKVIKGEKLTETYIKVPVFLVTQDDIQSGKVKVD